MLFSTTTQASLTLWLKSLSLLVALIIVHMNAMHHVMYMQLSISCPKCGNPKLGVVYSMAGVSLSQQGKEQTRQQCSEVFGASRSEPHTSALIDFRFACLLVCLLVRYGHLTENEVASRPRTLLAFD